MEDDAPEGEPHRPEDMPSICYAMAYFVLPRYAFQETERIVTELTQNPEAAAAFYYILTCKMDEKEPRDELVRSFAVHTGVLNDDFNYTILGYPTKSSVNVADLPDDDILDALEGVVLAPYFSAILNNPDTGEVKYFVLGQSPDGHTTLRAVTEGMNANLGRGCEPEISAFVALLRERI